MALSIIQLTTATTPDAALELLLDLLESLEFPARSWQEGSVNRVNLEVMADVFASNSVLIADITKGGFSDLATGLGLTAYSASAYENDRTAAVRAQYSIELTVASGSGPYSPAVGAVIIKDPVLDVRYRSTTALTLTSGTSPITGTFEAEVAGTAGNAPGVGAINFLVSALAGVTVTNPSGTPTLNGADEQGDPELRIANSNKWALLANQSPKGVYVALTLAADASVTRVSIDDTNATSAGAVIIYTADKDIGIAPATVLPYINARKGICDSITHLAAASLAQAVTYVATHDSTVFAAAADAEAAIDLALATYFETFAIGGEGPVGSKVLPLGGIYGVATAIPGIVNVTFTAPTADVAMIVSQVVIPTITGTSSAI